MDVKVKKPDGTWQSLVGPPGASTPAMVSLGGFLTLTNVGANYDTTPASKGLGIASIDFTNCTQIDFIVNVNKVGSGTQSWQLWNVTDGVEVVVINDAAGTGDKVLSVVKTTSLPTGVKTVRVRVKSTTAADDPVYYGSTIKVTY